MAPVPGDSSNHQFGTSMPQGGHPPHHSITSSARAESPDGTSRPPKRWVLWSAPDDWTVPHLIAPTELAGSILHSLPSAVLIASSDAKDVRADRTRHEYAPGFLIKTPP